MLISLCFGIKHIAVIIYEENVWFSDGAAECGAGFNGLCHNLISNNKGVLWVLCSYVGVMIVFSFLFVPVPVYSLYIILALWMTFMPFFVFSLISWGLFQCFIYFVLCLRDCTWTLLLATFAWQNVGTDYSQLTVTHTNFTRTWLKHPCTELSLHCSNYHLRVNHPCNELKYALITLAWE